MGFLDVNMCPNEECSEGVLLDKKLTICPGCGATIITLKVGSKEGRDLLNAKKEKAPNKAFLIRDDMTDEDLKTQIQKDMINLQSSEAGTGWMRFGTLISGNSTDQMLGAGFKALINQNKIIIRQNELILRALQRSESKPSPGTP